ncbi:MAG: nuclear transport factor 2 family protein [Hyphomicrobiales bacterium]|nr:nuclear transport factor 2 family protein [Hyphomicrobiales bacterium]
MGQPITKAEEGSSFAAYDAIQAPLQHYIEGARKGDSSLMRKAFLDGAHIRGSYAGKPVDWTLDEFCGLIDKHGPATEVEARVVTIEHSGTAAMARLEAENWRGTRYTDFFVLMEAGGAWKIASKVFFAHSRA